MNIVDVLAAIGLATVVILAGLGLFTVVAMLAYTFSHFDKGE